MHVDAAQPARFEPLHPASRRRVVAGMVLGPLLWLFALTLAGWVFEYTWAIELGLLVTLVTFVVSVIVLFALRAARERQEARYREMLRREGRSAVTS